MRKEMTGAVHIAGQAMITSLGEGVETNFGAVLQGRSGIRKCEDPRVTQSSVMAGIIPEEIYAGLQESYCRHMQLTKAELLAVACIDRIGKDLEAQGVDICGCRNAFVLASAKGNISALVGRCIDGGFIPEAGDPILFRSMLSNIVSWFRTQSRPVFMNMDDKDAYLISNACISGVSAIICARRLILSGKYDNVMVAGVDVQCRFITSGFASFKSLSAELCRPYDAAHCGLNLGEACGAILLTANVELASKMSARYGKVVSISGGAASDDANHISGPSRSGDGLYFAMRNAMGEAGISSDGVDMLQMHGTGTVYNDEMESKAAALAGLQNVPAQSLKPYFGHTMGASGVIETIIAAEELRKGMFAATPGYETHGCPMPLNVSAQKRDVNAVQCLKTASGFGGTNAAIVLSVAEVRHALKREKICLTASAVEISDGNVCKDGNKVFAASGTDISYHDFIREAYRAAGIDYPKFYKMDDLCKLGFMASEYLLSGITFMENECGVILSGEYGCLDTDMRHQKDIDTDGDTFASPATFVYTLPNVAAAEISIRHHIKGENVWFCSSDRDLNDIRDYAMLMMAASGLRFCIIGHIDFMIGKYFAKFELLRRSVGGESGKDYQL